MPTLRINCVSLIILGFAAACAQDTGKPEIVAPNDNPSVSAATSRSDDDREGDDEGDDDDRQIAIRDDCDPRDPGWGPTVDAC